MSRKQQKTPGRTGGGKGVREVEIPKEALVCAAQHFAAALESAKAQEPVDFGKVCEECRLLTECRADWLKTAAPIFEAAGVSPNLLWTDQPLDTESRGHLRPSDPL